MKKLIGMLVFLLCIGFAGCMHGDIIGSSLVAVSNDGTVKWEFGQGEYIKIIAVMVNKTNEPQILSFSTAQKYDLVISNQAGHLVWNWANNIIFDPNPSQLVFDPFEIKVFVFYWNQKMNDGQQIQDGTYDVTLEKAHPIFGVFAGPYSITIVE